MEEAERDLTDTQGSVLSQERTPREKRPVKEPKKYGEWFKY